MRQVAKHSPYLLVAEDDRDLRALLVQALQRAGYSIRECANGVELIDQLQALIAGEADTGIVGIVTDVRMPGITGLSILEGLHELDITLPVFMITAFGSPEFHSRSAELGAIRTFDKPFDIESLVSEVVRAVGVY